MDYLAPPLNAVLQIQLQLKQGASMRVAIQAYLYNNPSCPLAHQVEQWFLCLETGQSFDDRELNTKPYRKNLLEIFSRGLKGEPVLQILQDFQSELQIAAMQDLEQQVKKLPFLTLIPLFLFQVPAFFLLLLGPLILDLQSHLMG